MSGSDTQRFGVFFDHLAYKRVKAYAILPAKLRPRLRRVTQQNIHFRWPEISRIDLDQFLAACLIDAALLCSLSAPLEPAANQSESAFDKLTHRMAVAGCQHIVIRLLLLQHHPHA